MAGQILKSLKPAEAKAASHEARLSIMVITILAFAFSFLVYHKMDIRQRQLTDASIKSNAATAQASAQALDLDPAAAVVAAPTQTAATDPLINIGDLNDGSPFADSGFVLDEPISQSPQVATKSTTTTPAPAIVFQDSASSSDDLAEQKPDEPDFSAELAVKTPATTKVASAPEVDLPDFNFPPTETAEPPVATTVETPAPETTTAMLDMTTPSFPVLEDEEEPLGTGTVTAAAPQVEAALIAEAPSAKEAAATPSTDEPVFAFTLPESEPTPVETATPSQSTPNLPPEPVLLALVDPQQAGGFDNGFLIEEDAAPAKAPLNDPAEFPAFDPAPPVMSTPTVPAPTKPKSGTKAIEAISNPGKNANRPVIRTAAGSGADGKFSLAAFNYGNKVAPAALDDSSTYNSAVVQDGDNYTKISKRVYGTVRYFAALAVFNQHRIPEPKNMRPGMVVLVPPGEVLEERFPELFADSQPKHVEPAGFLLLDDGSPAYRVGERETISEISQRFLGRSARWIEIYRLNQSTLSDPNKLKPGTILALPADAVEVNVVP